MDMLLSILHNTALKDMSIKIQGVFKGVLRTKSLKDAALSEGRVPFGVGFGHMGSYPAELQLAEVLDLVISFN
jgi:hypothetical protein